MICLSEFHLMALGGLAWTSCYSGLYLYGSKDCCVTDGVMRCQPLQVT